MSITYELREYTGNFYLLRYKDVREKLGAIADRIDAEHDAKVAYWQEASYKDGYDEGFASADDWYAEHAAELAEHGWVRGPLDADGKMWRSGDMSDSNWGVIEGIAYEDGRWLVSGHDTSAPWVPADSIRHYHAPTVEDVLTEMLYKAHIYDEREMELLPDLIAEYATKLQLKEDA